LVLSPVKNLGMLDPALFYSGRVRVKYYILTKETAMGENVQAQNGPESEYIKAVNGYLSSL